ncbi:MAG: FKBP-type peptidyl-prolyl cis-trans isomerase [Firmicutes bacterium]|nr:FKBP-type peptidyl-prolyl cis-trans isomerase [Bacillota bacterium]
MKDKKRILLVGGVVLAVALVVAGFAVTKNSIKLPDEYDYDDLSEYITLGDYSNLEYESGSTEPTQSEVMEFIYSEMDQAAETKYVYEGTVGKDSIAVIDYDGRYRGTQIDGAFAEGVEIDMAAGGYVDGFLEGIIGRKVGETFTMQVVFPENYAGEYGGKTIDFTVTVQSLKKTVTPKYNDEYVRKNTEYSSTKAYEKAVRKQLKASNEANAENSAKLELFNQIMDNSKVKKYPEKELKSRCDQIKNTYAKIAMDNDLDFAEYLKNELGLTEEEFNKEVKATAKDAVKQELILRQIAELEGISVSKKDYNDYLDELLEKNGHTRSSYKKEMGISIVEYAESNNLYSSLLYNRVMDKIYSNSQAR